MGRLVDYGHDICPAFLAIKISQLPRTPFGIANAWRVRVDQTSTDIHARAKSGGGFFVDLVAIKFWLFDPINIHTIPFVFDTFFRTEDDFAIVIGMGKENVI